MQIILSSLIIINDFFSTVKHIALNKMWDLWYMKSLRLDRHVVVEYFYVLVAVPPCIIL